MSINYQTFNMEGVAKQIAANIRNSIVEGRLSVDDRLPTEEELAERFGVSRPTIREALKCLAAQNLIRTRRGPAGGSFVKKPSQEEVREQLKSMTAVLVSVGEFNLPDIVETRHVLEQMCCHLAAERRSEAELMEMEAELQVQHDPSITDVEFCASDVRFHCLVVDATHNPMMRFVMAAVLEVLQPVLNLIVYKLRERSLVIDYHQKIYASIRARDPGQAVAALDQLMEYLHEKYTAAQEWRLQKDSVK